MTLLLLLYAGDSISNRIECPCPLQTTNRSQQVAAV